jgi:transcription elongation factor Elf1
MDFISLKYAGIVGTRVERFVVKSTRPYRANMRCPVCGDSHKDKTKARGWLLENKEGRINYFCHNCNVSMSLGNLLKQFDATLADDYFKEMAFEKYGHSPKTDEYSLVEKMKTPKFVDYSALKNLKKISQLDIDHPARKYIVDRMIPTKYHSKLFYAPKFKEFVNSIVPNKFQDTKYDEPRLIIPLLDEKKRMFGFQGRSFGKSGIRYITIMLNEDKTKVYGLDDCDRSKQHFILEGPIDSMFVENSLAMVGGSVDWSIANEHSVFVYDNEPRSKDTIHRMEQAIEKGFKVVIFPDTIEQKDINEMILYDKYIDIQDLLCYNVYKGLEAKMKLVKWKKV